MINTQVEKFYNMVGHFASTNVGSEERQLQFTVITEKYVELLKNIGIEAELIDAAIVLIDNQPKMLESYKFTNLQELQTYFLHLQNVKKTYVKSFGYANFVGGFCPMVRCYDVIYMEQNIEMPVTNIQTTTSIEETTKLEKYANTLLSKEHKITLEEAIEHLIEIRDRFQKAMSGVRVLNGTSGIVLSIKEGEDRYSLVMSKEYANDLLNLYK